MGRSGKAVLATGLIGLLLGSGLAWATDGRSEQPASAQTTPRPKKAIAVEPASDSAADSAGNRAAGHHPGLDRAPYARALRYGSRAGEALGGTIEAAVLSEGWREPVTYGDTTRSMRMWSMVKPLTAIALYMHDMEPSHAVESAIAGALERSENCRQRRIVLELQRLTGSAPQTRSYLQDLLRPIGAEANLGRQTQGPDVVCADYLRGDAGEGLRDPLAPSLLLGTSTWTIGDAVRFAAGLGARAYGEGGELVLQWMSQPKKPSREAQPGTLTMHDDFGAGRALRDFKPAYKAGWGGQLERKYLVGQIGVVRARGTWLAFAVMFHPTQNPVDADPGKTVAPKAIETVLATVADGLNTTG